jgi:FtsH-binding integral membrane protein
MIGYGVWLWVTCLLMAIFTEIAIICCRHLARKVPINFLMLLVFTACEAYTLSATCVYYAAVQPGVALKAFCGTAMMSLACTLYAFTTRKDFTYGGGLMWILSFTLLFFVLILLPIFSIEGNYIGYDILIAIIVGILGIYMIHDTQLIIGKGRWKLSLDDYILGAMVLYVDIITMFLYLLALFSKK